MTILNMWPTGNRPPYTDAIDHIFSGSILIFTWHHIEIVGSFLDNNYIISPHGQAKDAKCNLGWAEEESRVNIIQLLCASGRQWMNKLNLLNRQWFFLQKTTGEMRNCRVNPGPYGIYFPCASVSFFLAAISEMWKCYCSSTFLCKSFLWPFRMCTLCHV